MKTAKYVDYIAILAVNVELQYMLDKLVKVEKNYGIKINTEKTKVLLRISKKRKKCLSITVNEKNLQEHFNYFG